jgi:sec-independent protein translocase protein TatA
MGFVNIGPLELLVLLVLALLVLGPKRLPEAARSVGRGMREMKEALAGGDDDDDEEAEEVPERTSGAKDPDSHHVEPES